MELIQCNVYLALTGAIKGTSKEKRYAELGLESPQHRRWDKILTNVYKIYKKEFLYNLLN